MKRVIGIIAVTATASIILASCVNEAREDLEGIVGTDPDSVVVLNAPDLFPNIAITCYEGHAFVSHTRENLPVQAVPGLNDICAR